MIAKEYCFNALYFHISEDEIEYQNDKSFVSDIIMQRLLFRPYPKVVICKSVSLKFLSFTLPE
jgi:hypothetical protein